MANSCATPRSTQGSYGPSPYSCTTGSGNADAVVIVTASCVQMFSTMMALALMVGAAEYRKMVAVGNPTNEVRTTLTSFDDEPRNTTQSVGVAYGAVAVMRYVYVAFVLPADSALIGAESSPKLSVSILPPCIALRSVVPGTLTLPVGMPVLSSCEAPVKFVMISPPYIS